MPNISFPPNGKATFPTKYHGDVTLSEGKWTTICSEPERLYYSFNGDRIATTLINPDLVRCHAHKPTQFLYYKRFSRILLTESIEVPRAVYFAVVLDEETKRVCTVYPVLKPKPGKAYAPPK